LICFTYMLDNHFYMYVKRIRIKVPFFFTKNRIKYLLVGIWTRILRILWIVLTNWVKLTKTNKISFFFYKGQIKYLFANVMVFLKIYAFTCKEFFFFANILIKKNPLEKILIKKSGDRGSVLTKLQIYLFQM